MERVNFSRLINTLLAVSVLIPFALQDILGGFTPWNIAVSAFIVGWVFIGFSFYYFGKWSRVDRPVLFRVEREPVVKISTITGDTPASFYGTVRCENQPLISPYTKTSCVYYHYIKEKYDGEHWRVVETRCNHVPFFVDDGTGCIHIRFGFIRQPLTEAEDEVGDLPDYSNSELDARKAVYQHEYSEKGLVPLLPDRYRVSEYVLEPNMKVFVYGWTYKKDSKRIAVASRNVPLIVSRKTKDAYLQDFAVGDSFFYTHNFLLYIGVIVLYFAIDHFFSINMAFLLVALAGITARMVIQIRNRMVVLRNRIRNAESQIVIETKNAPIWCHS